MLVAPLVEEAARRRARAPADLEARVAALYDAARATWPAIQITPESFVAYVAARWPDKAPLETWLTDVHGSDLYLACACMQSAPGALATFDRAFMPAIADYLARSRPDPAFVEDVRQTLREKLFVGATPKLAEFSGRGPLGGWMRVLAVRTAIDLRRRRGEQTPDLASQGTPPRHPELVYLSRRYRGDVEDALRRALASLDDDQRMLLRLHFVEGVTLDELAGLRGVHRATITRHLSAARRAVLAETRRLLNAALALPADELESLFGALQSQLQVSVARLLAS